MVTKYIGRKIKKGMLGLGIDLILFGSLIGIGYFGWKVLLLLLGLAYSVFITVASVFMLLGTAIVLVYYLFQFLLPKGR